MKNTEKLKHLADTLPEDTEVIINVQGKAYEKDKTYDIDLVNVTIYGKEEKKKFSLLEH